MDLAKKRSERQARLQAKKDQITAQAESIAPSEAEAVAEAAPSENTEETKEQK